MGWWAKDIMAGDPPLDWEDEIYGICGVEKWQEGKSGKAIIPPAKFSEHMEEITQTIRKGKDPIGYQVLGILMMESGAEMSKEIKDKILQACHDDEWARVDEERQKKVLEFHDMVLKYNGDKVVIKTKGLFETIADHIAAGKTGLVNK